MQPTVPEDRKYPYVGLYNQGATCYMNSLLQALFNTPEFQCQLFKWKYSEKMHQKPADCIPLQLQKLFARMLLKMAPYADTKDLIKSFQWDTIEGFEQHDIQEFCRVLFSAIEESLIGSTEGDPDFIGKLYEGLLGGYIECLTCHSVSTREEKYRDIQLSLRTSDQKKSYGSVEMALNAYFTPERLEGDNMYSCETCKTKVNALKYYKLMKLPPILCLQLNRFTYDPATYTKVKLNDRMTFPLTLNMNFFLNPYSTLYEASVESKDPLNELIATNPLLATIEGVSANLPSEEEKQREKDTERKIEVKQQQLEDIVKGEGGGDVSEKPKAHIHSITGKKCREDAKKARELRKKHAERMKKLKGGNFRKNINPAFFSNAKGAVDENKGWAFEFDTTKPDVHAADPEVSEELKKAEDERKAEESKKEAEEQKIIIKESEIMEIDRKNKEKCLKEGEYVYELFAILVHSGSAYGGHYFAYIKDLTSGSWLSYNDVTVRPIRISEIQRVFGGHDTKKSFHNHTNAYMLMYRKVGLPINQMEPGEIPDYVAEVIDKEEKAEKVEKMIAQERQAKMQVKVFYGDKTKVVDTMRTHTYEQLLDETLKVFELTTLKKSNCRLRSYNVPNQTMQETYTGKEKLPLEELRIYPQKSLALEIKKDEEVFEEFDPSQIQIKVNFWRPNIVVLDEAALKPTKLFVKKTAKLSSLLDTLEKMTEIPKDYLLIGRKLPMGNARCLEIISGPENLDKTLAQLRVNEGINVFVEDTRVEYPVSEDCKLFSGEKKCKWEIEHELEKNRYTLKFNNPREAIPDQPAIDYKYYVNVDRRQTIDYLKQKISKELLIPRERLILRRGGIHGLEMKNDATLIKDSHFYNMASVFVEEGVPASIGENRLIIFEATYSKADIDNCFYDFQQLWSGPLNTKLTVKQFKEQLAGKIGKDAKLMRLREKNNDKLTKVYHDSKQMDSYNMYEGKQIAVQMLQEPENPGEDELLIMIQLWDPNTWSLSPIKELYVERTCTLTLFAALLSSIFDLPAKDIKCCKIASAWNFSRVQLPHETWHPLEGNDGYVGAAPFFLTTDGTMFVVKNAEAKERPLTEEERKAYAAFDYELAAGGSRVAGAVPVKKEKALVITVKKS